MKLNFYPCRLVKPSKAIHTGSTLPKQQDYWHAAWQAWCLAWSRDTGMKTRLCPQESKGLDTPEAGRARELLRDIEDASKQGTVYFRGRAVVYAKPGTNQLSKLVRLMHISCVPHHPCL